MRLADNYCLTLLLPPSSEVSRSIARAEAKIFNHLFILQILSARIGKGRLSKGRLKFDETEDIRT